MTIITPSSNPLGLGLTSISDTKRKGNLVNPGGFLFLTPLPACPLCLEVWLLLLY